MKLIVVMENEWHRGVDILWRLLGRCLKSYRNKFVAAVAVVATWLMVGALVYFVAGNCSTVPRLERDGSVSEATACPWNFPQSFYFSVQTGLSIGYGLFQETEPASKSYSMLHIVLGSSVMSGALAIFAHLILVRMNFIEVAEKAVVSATHSKLCLDDFRGVNSHELCRLVATYSHFAEKLICKLEGDPEKARERIDRFKRASEREKIWLSKELVREARQRIHGFMKTEDATRAVDEGDDHCLSFVRRFRAHHAFLINLGILTSWTSLGIFFSVNFDNNDFLTAFYFSVSTLSTAGIVAVKTVETNGHVLFAAFFALVGVPIYAMFWGSFANILVEKVSRSRTQDTVRDQLWRSEKEFAERWAEHASKERVVFSEFMELQLLRMGRIDRKCMESLRRHFDQLDPDHSGFIDANSLWKTRDAIDVRSTKST